MINFLITQIILVSTERLNNFTQHSNWSTIIRIVDANNVEEALGRFMIKTKFIKAEQKLEPEINVLKDIIKY